MKKRILLADDHTIFRQGVRKMLEEETDFEIVAEAENGRKALRIINEQHVDVVVMDISMPDLNGIEATRQIMHDSPDARVVALSMHEDHNYVSQMLQAGASAYLIKGADISDLVRAIRSVLEGHAFLSPQIAGYVVDTYSGKIKNAAVSMAELSGREREIVQLIAEGKSSKEIAGELFISAGTVEKHRKNIMEKLNLHSIAELTRYAIKNGLSSL